MKVFRIVSRRTVSAFLLAAAALFGASGAHADPVECQRYRGELASLNGSDAPRALQGEIARLQAYKRSLNCEGGQFLFFDTRPPQCSAVEQRIKALNDGYGAPNGEVVAARRRALISAISLACAPGEVLEDGLPLGQTARGGGQVICVRTCDGAFFPMSNLPDGRGGADAMCKALCPGTDAVAYSMPFGDDALRYAATLRGNRSYVSMPNAFKFRKSFEPSCTCKREGEGWAQSLAKAESMLYRHKEDIFVTPMQAERLSRAPKVRLTLVGRADKTVAGLAADAANREGGVVANAAAPGEATSAGAEVEQAAAADKPGIRVIAPDLIPAPARQGKP